MTYARPAHADRPQSLDARAPATCTPRTGSTSLRDHRTEVNLLARQLLPKDEQASLVDSVDAFLRYQYEYDFY
jgi:hypothetical protein